ncbi:hypothetical protein RRG08_064650 [Elysia crispata]|uniref:Uncharacterized protein n=1 Tax=Elysia crispata TaxID=231223 RepID=A0AAE1B9H7_9GAST|nr:hypothetical protein RRG08_064650 [Elysia crispata]
MKRSGFDSWLILLTSPYPWFDQVTAYTFCVEEMTRSPKSFSYSIQPENASKNTFLPKPMDEKERVEKKSFVSISERSRHSTIFFGK